MHLLKTWYFFGPNWRADFPLVEKCFACNKQELRALGERGAVILEELGERLRGLGVGDAHLEPLRRKFPGDPGRRLGFLFNGVAIALQLHAGLAAKRTAVLISSGDPWLRALFEIEESESGDLAALAALMLLKQSMPEWQSLRNGRPPSDRDVEQVVQALMRRAREIRLPPAGAAIVAAAARAGLPCQNLLHGPYGIPPDAGGNPPGFVLGQGVHAQLLDASLPTGQGGLDRSAAALISGAYPRGTPSRIPLLAVTGTNGKTTTCRMLERILRESGQHTGLACSEGIYVDGRAIELHDSAGQSVGMHHRLLIHPAVEVAVMEFPLSHIKHQGFPYDWCDVAVMTNVTADHLDPGWETVDKLARTKRGVLERARHGVVLNADDPSTPGMLPHLKARRVAMTTAAADPRDCHEQAGRRALWVGIEVIDEVETIVVYDNDSRVELVAARALPATLGGQARHNLENALQAVAAGWLLGIDAPVLRAALLNFEMGIDTTPGRLNIYDGLPFRVIMDYAHNEDGIRRMGEMVDGMQVRGRKILMFALTGDRSAEVWQGTVRAAVGHFDHYVCRNYPGLRGREPDEMPPRMKQMLEAAGIGPEAITVCLDSDEGIHESLRMAEPGDLLVMTAGIYEFKHMWEMIRAGPQPATHPSGAGAAERFSA